MTKSPINARIDSRLASDLDELHWQTRQTKTEIIEAALREYIAKTIVVGGSRNG
jgi:predicted transcriptional regulator